MDARRRRMRAVGAGAGQLAPVAARCAGGGGRGGPERATLQVRSRARGWGGVGWAGAAPDSGLLQEE